MPVKPPYLALRDYLLKTSADELTLEAVTAKARTLYGKWNKNIFRRDLQEAAEYIGKYTSSAATAQKLEEILGEMP